MDTSGEKMAKKSKISTKTIDNTRFSKSLEEKVYWVQLTFTVLFSIFVYYALELRWIAMGFLVDIIFLTLIHPLLIVIISFLILFYRTQESPMTCLKGSLSSLGTIMFLFLMILGVAHVVNI